jgi:hypothetical protein
MAGRPRSFNRDAALQLASEVVREVRVVDTRVDWVLNTDGRTVHTTKSRIPYSLEALVLLEVAGVHACHHARVEPTFLLLDDMLDFYHPKGQVKALERLQQTAEHAQIAVISHSPFIAEARDWTLTTLDSRRAHTGHHDSPIDFEVNTTRIPPPDC